MTLLVMLLQRSAAFQADAPTGTGLEWLTVWALVIPAVLLVLLVYLGARTTV